MASKIRVRAGDGLKIPMPAGLGRDTGVTVITPETSVEVLYNRFTRKRIECGDFVAEGEPTDIEAPLPEPTAPEAPSADQDTIDTVDVPARRAFVMPDEPLPGVSRRRREEE